MHACNSDHHFLDLRSSRVQKAHMFDNRDLEPTYAEAMGDLSPQALTEPGWKRLANLSKGIEENIRILTEYLHAKGLGAPSFDPSGLADFPSVEPGSDAARARKEIIALTKELHDLTVGPREGLKTLAWDSISYIALQAVSEFKIAEAVPRSGTISYIDLASEVKRLTGISLLYSDLRRLARLAIVNKLFHEPSVGFIAHNRASLLLLEDETLAGWLGMYSIDLFLPIAYTIPAMKKWPASEESNETVIAIILGLRIPSLAVNIAYNHTLPFFKHVQADQSRSRRFDLSMRASGSREDFDVKHTILGYPWADLGKATVVDLGGNDGFVSFALAEAFPTLSFIVQELPGKHPPEVLEKVPKHLAERVKLVSHDFFRPQPIVAEVYFFRHIFHAFSDKYAVKILQGLIPVLRPGSRILINDSVLPEPGSLSFVEEKHLRTLDVLMQTVNNAREREVDDWKALFTRADPRFKWRNAWRSAGTVWFVEVTWEG
ncbi:6-hydroxytryprostatin B O-methyltransferase [Paramyrothecium foliicola]|nr:6-hydroxytryprostatin B O-methyltransferase [Paramyrothecium foliicola]